MATSLDDKIDKLIKSIEDLSVSISDMGGNSALQSSNDDVRRAAEDNAMRRLKMESALLEKKEKLAEEEWRKFKQKQIYEEKTSIGKTEKWFNKQKETWGGVAEGFVGAFNKVKGIARDVWGFFMKAVGDLDKAAVSAYRTMGMSVESMKNMRQHAVSIANSFETAKNFNADSAELLKMQVSYSREIGRNISLSGEQLANLAALKQLVGEEQAIKYSVNFEKMGYDVNSTTKEMVELFNDATKSGLNFSKYSAAVAENLHLAQQYTFRDGIDGLTRMAKQSTAIRWNMQQTAAFAEKVSSVEGAVTTSAQMSVLGGEFAQFANPMNMLYESLNDMEGLNDRLVKMFSQFATFNERTKQIEVSAFDRMRIKSAAQAMGLDYGQVMDSVFGMGRAKLADKHLRGSDLNDDYKEFLKNKAQIDRKTGRTYVTMLGEDGKEKKKFLDESFSDEEKKSLDAEMRTESQDIKSIAKSAMSIDEMLEAIKKQVFEKIRQWIEDNGGIDYVKEKINKLADIGLKVVDFIADSILPNIKTIAITMGSLLLAVKVIPAILKGIAWYRAGTAASALPFGGGMGYGSPMMMGGGVGYGPSMMMGGGNMLRKGYTFDGRLNGGKGGFRNIRTGQTASASKALKTGGGGMSRMGGLATAGLGLAGMGLSIGGDYLKSTADGDKSRENWGRGLSVAGKTASWAATGAMIGSVIPGIGTAVGAVIGGVAGLASGLWDDHKEQQAKKKEINEYNRTSRALSKLRGMGIFLQGEYTPEELEEMVKGYGQVSTSTKKKMHERGDGKIADQFFAKGGEIIGDSHAHGGVKIIAEGGEMIVPKEASLKNRDAVKSLIDGTFNQKYTPMIAEKPMGDIMKVSNTSVNGISQTGNTKIDFSSLNMNMGGTLKLELAGEYKNIDAKKLLNDAAFNRTLEGMIREQTAQLGDRNKRHALSRYDNPDPNGRHVRWS
jgi:hypothetical protein